MHLHIQHETEATKGRFSDFFTSVWKFQSIACVLDVFNHLFRSYSKRKMFKDGKVFPPFIHSKSHAPQMPLWGNNWKPVWRPLFCWKHKRLTVNRHTLLVLFPLLLIEWVHWKGHRIKATHIIWSFFTFCLHDSPLKSCLMYCDRHVVACN